MSLNKYYNNIPDCISRLFCVYAREKSGNVSEIEIPFYFSCIKIEA